MPPFQRGGLVRIDFAGDVDEAPGAVDELRVEGARVHPKRLRGSLRDLSRVHDLAWIGEDRGRLLADRELDAGAVEDRPPAGGNDKRLPLLARAPAGEAARLHGLQPGRPRERDG